MTTFSLKKKKREMYRTNIQKIIIKITTEAQTKRNKCIDMPCYWMTGRLNITKMLILPKLICKVRAILIKSHLDYL